MTAAIENNLTGKDNGHMEYNKKIADMRSGDIVEGFYILKGAYPKTTAAGKPFLSASLADASGVIDAKVWDYTGPIGVADEGRIIKLRGTVSEYRGTPQIVIDRDLLLTGTLLHDFAKSKEFAFSELGLVTNYSTGGQLLGHLVMGAQEVADTAKELGIPNDKSMLVQHMILSHHGEPEFGAAVRPLFAEAELLSCIDMIDSRMEIYREVLNDLSVGEFSDRIFALERRVYKPHEVK